MSHPIIKVHDSLKIRYLQNGSHRLIIRRTQTRKSQPTSYYLVLTEDSIKSCNCRNTSLHLHGTPDLVKPLLPFSHTFNNSVSAFGLVILYVHGSLTKGKRNPNPNPRMGIFLYKINKHNIA